MFKKFLKLPLLITSGVLALVGLVVIVVYACLPVAHSAYTYKNTTTVAGKEYVTEVSLKFKGDEVTVTSKVNGEEQFSQTVNYQVKKGQLEVVIDEEVMPIGKINAYSYTGELIGEEITVVNHTAKALTGVAIALLVVGVLGAAGSVTYMLLDKKKKSA